MVPRVGTEEGCISGLDAPNLTGLGIRDTHGPGQNIEDLVRTEDCAEILRVPE